MATPERQVWRSLNNNDIPSLLRLFSIARERGTLSRSDALDHGARMARDLANSVDELGWAVIHALAALEGTADVIQLLVDAGGNVNVQHKDTMTTPLHLAARSNVVENIMVLLRCGAKVTLRENINGWTPLEECVYADSPEAVKAILDAISFDYPLTLKVVTERGPFGNTPLQQAAKFGDLESCRLLVDAVGESDKSLLWAGNDVRGTTPLHYAAAYGEAKVAEYLILGGSDPNIRDDMRMTPLHIAADCDEDEVVHALLLGGADARAVNRLGQGVVDVVHAVEVAKELDPYLHGPEKLKLLAFLNFEEGNTSGTPGKPSTRKSPRPSSLRRRSSSSLKRSSPRRGKSPEKGILKPQKSPPKAEPVKAQLSATVTMGNVNQGAIEIELPSSVETPSTIAGPSIRFQTPSSQIRRRSSSSASTRSTMSTRSRSSLRRRSSSGGRSSASGQTMSREVIQHIDTVESFIARHTPVKDRKSDGEESLSDDDVKRQLARELNRPHDARAVAAKPLVAQQSTVATFSMPNSKIGLGTAIRDSIGFGATHAATRTPDLSRTGLPDDIPIVLDTGPGGDLGTLPEKPPPKTPKHQRYRTDRPLVWKERFGFGSKAPS